MKRTFIIAGILFALMLTGCQHTTTENPTSVPSPTPALSTEAPSPTEAAHPTDVTAPTDTPAPSATEAPTETPVPTSLPGAALSDVYDYGLSHRTDVYRLDIPDISQNYTIDEGEIRDGYVLLRLRTSEPVSIKMASFPLLHPEQIKFCDVDNYWDMYRLASNGNIIEVLPDSNALNLLDSSFSKVCGIGSGICNFIGVDSKNRCWYLTESGHPAYINLFTSETAVFNGESFLRADSILYEEGDNVYLSVSGGAFVSFPIKINTATKSVDSDMNFVSVPDPIGPYVFYNSANTWFYSKLTDLTKIYSLAKSYEEENFWKCVGDIAITASYNFDFGSESNGATESFNVFDLAHGGIGSALSSAEFSSDASLSLSALSEDGLVLIISTLDDASVPYIWDVHAVSSLADSSFRVLEANSLDSEIGKLVSNIENEYGINVYIDEESLSKANGNYELSACTERFLLISGLTELNRCLSEYPKNFFNEVIGNFRESLDFYISDSLRSATEYVVDDPDAFVSYLDNSIIVCIAIRSMQENFGATLAHEMMHVMDDAINDYSQAHSQDILEYWTQTFSPSEYPYYYAFFDDEGYEVSDISGTVADGDPDAWYIDAYSRTYPAEDRARVLEYMYIGEDSFFESENLRNKALFLTAVIRKIFPSIAACEQPVLWEKLLGIEDADFSIYTFPPYVPKG